MFSHRADQAVGMGEDLEAVGAGNADDGDAGGLGDLQGERRRRRHRDQERRADHRRLLHQFHRQAAGEVASGVGLRAAAQEAADAEAADARKSQVRTVDRSERVRTYNFPENRIADHRVNYKAHNLDAVLDGDLDAVIEALTEADLAARLAGS